MGKEKLKPYQVRLIRELKVKREELMRLRRLTRSRQFQRLGREEQALIAQQVSYAHGIVLILEARIDIF